MIHPFDDYPIHQATLPLTQPVDGDPNRYDRYFFHGYVPSTGVIFVVAFGLYPNRTIVDGAMCVSHNHAQRSVFTSGRMDPGRATASGPLQIEIVEPLQTLRVLVDAPEQGLAAELTFQAVAPAVQEPRQTMMDRSRIVMDTCRYTQFGRWAGTLTSGDKTWSLSPARAFGTRDRSWGVRPLSGAVPVAPATSPAGIWWLWAPLQLDDGRCLHVAVSEAPDGARTLEGAMLVTPGEGPADAHVEHLASIEHEVTWEPGTRRARRVELLLGRRGAADLRLTLRPKHRIYMRGAGYTHLEWGHGTWHGDDARGAETLQHTDVTANDFTTLHVQQLVEVSGDVTGWGMCEQLAIGDHAPSGLTGFMDPFEA